MPEIKLTQGKFAIVDDEDYSSVSQFSWYAVKFTRGNVWYAHRAAMVEGRRTTLTMHRFILQPPSSDIEVDHINLNGLDNRRNNLRFATGTQNRQNLPKYGVTTSKYKGVWLDKSNGTWTAKISINNKSCHLGRFDNEELAALAYDEAARAVQGKFARLNFPLPGEQSALE